MKEAQTNIDELLNNSPSITALTDRCEAIADVNMTVILDNNIDTSDTMLSTTIPEIIVGNKPVSNIVDAKTEPDKDTTKQSTPVESSGVTGVTGATGSSLSTDTLSRKVLRTVGKVAIHAITSSLTRKAVVASTLYFSGATLASVVGLGPLVAVSAVAWFL